MVAISKIMHTLMGGAAANYMKDQSQGFSSGLSACDLSNATVPIPANQAILQAPASNESVSFVGVAFGVQNYTCSSAGNYTNVGAVAELFDISCFYGTDLFSTIQEPLFAAWENFTDGYTVQEAIEFLPAIVPADLILAQHFFQPNAAGSVSPVWDFRATDRFSNDTTAFFVGKGKTSLPSPIDPATNINWLDVANVSGSIATEVFRVSTLGGQPPTSCTAGSPDISVKYTSQYWFLNLSA